jgi:hypothetical protein
MATGWGASTWSSNTWGGSQVALTGVTAQPTVGGVDPKPLPQLYEVHADALVGTAKSAVTVSISGNSATGNVGISVFAIPATGVSAVGSLGSLSASSAYGQTVSGVLSSAAVQSVIGDRLVSITGCAAMANIGNFGYRYWSVIDDSQTPSWNAINDNQTPNWTSINTFENPNWVEIVTN